MKDQKNEQSPHWLDQLANEILLWQEQVGLNKLHVDDMKTPSGRVHTGALRGVLLHDFIAKVLEEHLSERSQKTALINLANTYVFNDMDPMDGLPKYLKEKNYLEHMGKPLYQIPAPALDECGIDLSKITDQERADLEKANNFAEFYAQDFIHAFRKLGCSQKIIWSHDLYESGQMDEVIRLSLDNVDKFRKIYKEVAEYDLPENWYPFQVICPVCGKIGTTLVTDWDGQEVTYICREQGVDWAKGCGHQGKISPFAGNGKLLWKVDWPAHWLTLGVNIEGAGKDHTSAGGSRDMADAICREVFDFKIPFNIPYEWILIRGSKMSSSKGVGTSAREFTALFPASVGRFLFLNKHYSQVIDFDPRTMAIPDLFDDYDQAARIYWGQEEGDQRLARAFVLAQVKEIPKAHFLARFRDLALWVQYPEKDVFEEATQVKGSALTDLEKSEITDRINYIELWLSKYAPEEFQWRAKKDLPINAKELSQEQKLFLTELEKLIQSQKWQAQDLQQAIFDLAKSSLGAKQGFAAIYTAFLGKKSGPRAAWFLLEIDPKLREKRIEEINHLN
jgi:lysyl-tRNA synthetase class 1